MSLADALRTVCVSTRLIIEEVKKATQGKIAVLARINCADEVPGGLDVHDSAAIAAYLESCGLDGLHVSRAVHIKDEFMWAPTVIHGGFSAAEVEEIKRAVNIPVITVGRYTKSHSSQTDGKRRKSRPCSIRTSEPCRSGYAEESTGRAS